MKDLSTGLSTDARASRSLAPGRAVLSTFQPFPSDVDIPLTGDADNLWTTDDSAARNYQSFASPTTTARARTAAMRFTVRFLLLGTNGNRTLYPKWVSFQED